MRRNLRRNYKRRQKQKEKPSAKSFLSDIQEIAMAIDNIKKVVNLPGMKSILTSLYGEKRYAEQLLAKNYPRIARRTAKELNTGGRKGKREKEMVSPPASAPAIEPTTKGEKIARGWRYAGAIKKNYSNNPAIAKMSKAEIRGEYKKFKRGLKTRVPGIVFYNPSP